MQDANAGGGSYRSRHAQIAKRRREHLAQNPDARIISLGIGDTTEPIPSFISDAMADAARGLGTAEGYSGCDRLRRLSLERYVHADCHC